MIKMTGKEPMYKDPSEYIACPGEDDFFLLLKYTEFPLKYELWKWFGKEPSTQEAMVQDPGMQLALDVGGADMEFVKTEQKRELKLYAQAQREEPIVKRWAQNEEQLRDYLRNHINLGQCIICRINYIGYLVEKSMKMARLGRKPDLIQIDESCLAWLND